MSALPVGAGAGLLAAVGLLLVLSALRRGRIGLAHRLAPYVHRRARTSGLLRAAAPPEDSRTVCAALVRSLVRAARVLERVGSSAASVRRRLERAGGALGYEELRLQQLVWAGAGLVATLGGGMLLALVRPVNAPVLIAASLLAALSGAAGRDWWLSREVERRRARIEAQLPDVVELLALVVGAGQGPVAAIERVVALGRGALVDELSLALAEVRAGTVLTTALVHLEQRVASPRVARLSEAIAIALERGTPLADVLRSQAADSREAARRELMEEGGRREIAQMVPVVFLVLPITVVFALFPGLFVLRIGL